MAKLEKIKEFYEALKKVEAQLQGTNAQIQRTKARKGMGQSVIVGYTQNYAVYVHENLEAHHPVGRAKFLEQPAREFAKELGLITAEAVKRGANLLQGLLLAGLRLQRESQKLVPVDTSALKNSAFTRVD